MEALKIYSYSNSRQFLLDSLAQRQRLNPGFSVRGWAKEMGLSSHSLLVLLLQGKRPLRVKHAQFLSRGLKLANQESLYLQALLQFESASSPEEKELCSHWLSELNPGREVRTKEMESYLAISHWLYTTILAMTDLRNFDFSPENITARLKKRNVSLQEVRAAMERLFSLGLLVRKDDGSVKCSHQKITTRNDILDVGVRKYHQAAADAAKEAVENLTPDLREFQSFSFSIEASKIPLAKEMIRKFRLQFEKAVESTSGEEICQMNLQFFQLTESRAPGAQDEGVDTGITTISKKGTPNDN